MDDSSLSATLKLPVREYKDRILEAVDTNQVTIITAETGAGKSTQIPQYLAEHGYQRIIVTQPRILAARNLCSRVRQEMSWHAESDCTKLVGYRTAPERDDDPNNVILYCTDGLQLVREITGSGVRDKQVLILDEIHEWNENMEVLIAWSKKRCQDDPTFKVVLMSATIEATELARYFASPVPITVPGRSYPVDKRFASDLISEIITRAQSKVCNMLVFLPGKAEIETVADTIASEVGTVPVIPLHSQLSPEDQQRAFAGYPAGKIVLATNVAQTSITIDDIDTVIDSGLERRSEVRNGVEGLFISEVSQADCLQRAGRAGRTKPGVYVLAQFEQLPCSPLQGRPEYGVPEILRKHIDRLVLRLANIGLDIEDLDFFHSPSRRTIKLAKSTLRNLGALTDTGGVTAIGRKMEHFPVESSYARMLVEAEQFSGDIQALLASIIAIQEVGGIVKGGPRHAAWQRYVTHRTSDLLAQYDVYLMLPTINPLDFEELGIIDKNTTKALEVNERLNHDLGLGPLDLKPIDPADEETLLYCIIAGQMHQIWLVEHTGQATHLQTKQTRELSSTSVVRRSGLIAGTPFDLQVPLTSGELETLHLVNQATNIHPVWLEQLSPTLFVVRQGKKYFDEHTGMLMTRMQVMYNKRVFETSGMPVLESTSENQRLFITLFSLWIQRQLESESRQYIAAHNRIPPISAKQIQDRIRYIAPGIISLAELSKAQKNELLRLTKLETYFDQTFMAGLKRRIQDSFHKHRTHHGWRKDKKHKDRRRDR